MKRALRLSIIFFLFPFLALAQSEPTLGVVLSGGGAKGMAHVGVLKAMEEAGLRPDFIAGTSMGSVVGGLYAIGYSADEIEEIILGIDWNQLLANGVPLNYISFEEKEYYGRYLLEFPVDGIKPKLPTGLIEGHVLSELLHYYTWNSTGYSSFDEFPIIYRCVATDVRSGEAIVFEDGPLQTAIRASMALPTAFTAVDLDSTLAVDGGVVNNFPVDIMRKLGADYVVGVDVSYVSDAPVPSSMVGILMNLAMLQSERAMPAMIDLCDIYIHPDLEGNSTASFGNAEQIVEIGHRTGRIYADSLKALANEIGMNRKHFSVGDTSESYVLKELNFEGNALFGDQLINNKLGIEKGDTIDRDKVREAVRRVYGINGFQNVDYTLKLLPSGGAAMNLRMREKLRNSLSVSLHIDNAFATGLLLNFTARDLLFRESRSVFIADISSNPKFRFDYYKYAGSQKNFAVNLRYDYISREIPLYEKGEVTDIVTNIQQEFQLNFLTTQSLRQSFQFGGFYSTRKDRTDLGLSIPAAIGDVTAESLGLRAAYLRNNLNDRNFPTTGAELLVLARVYFTSNYGLDFKEGTGGVDVPVGDTTIVVPKEVFEEFLKEIQPDFYGAIFIDYRKFFSFNKKNQLISSFRLGAILSTEVEGKSFNTFRLGGQQRVLIDDARAYGYNYTELEPENFGLLGLSYQRVLFGNLFLQGGANVISTYRYVPLDNVDAFSFSEMLEDFTTLGYGVSANFRTRLGPFSAGVSRNTSDSNFRYHFSYGFSFNYSD
ncbi:MAG: NTE family protein [Cryomorphaceae bacterium]|jgi:NTE family protein